MPLDLLLIHPPVVRPSEPPLGVATLAGFLRHLNVKVDILDLNVEIFHDLLSDKDLPSPQDSFSKRSLKQHVSALAELRSPAILLRPTRYRSFISQLDRILWLRSDKGLGPRISLTDFRHHALSPLRTRDLLEMALRPDAGTLQPFMNSRVFNHIRDRRPRLIGISVNYLSQALPAMALAGGIRNAFPELRILCGGSLITAWGERIVTNTSLHPIVNGWICGPGEIRLAQMLGVRAQKNPGPYPPSFEGVPWHLYLSPERILPLSTSTGCYWKRCLFCPETVTGAAYESVSLEDLPRFIEMQMDQNAPRWIHFTDNALSPAALETLSRTRTGALWFGFARFEKLLGNRRLVTHLHQAGCRMLQLGLESGSQRLLDDMRKGIRLDEAVRILKVLHEEGIGTYVYVMFGMPGESRDDALRTLQFVENHTNWIDFLSCSIMNLPHGFDYLEHLETFPFPGNGDDLSLYTDFRSAHGMERKAARLFLERRFRRSPSIAEVLSRTPPVFTSNHAPLFYNAHRK